MYRQLNGPSLQGTKSVSTSPVALRVDTSNLEGRIALSFQPTNGVIYFGFDNTVTATTGTKVFKNQIVFLECSDKQDIFLVAQTGTVDVRITEMG